SDSPGLSFRIVYCNRRANRTAPGPCLPRPWRRGGPAVRNDDHPARCATDPRRRIRLRLGWLRPGWVRVTLSLSPASPRAGVGDGGNPARGASHASARPSPPHGQFRAGRPARPHLPGRSWFHLTGAKGGGTGVGQVVGPLDVIEVFEGTLILPK